MKTGYGNKGKGTKTKGKGGMKGSCKGETKCKRNCHCM